MRPVRVMCDPDASRCQYRARSFALVCEHLAPSLRESLQTSGASALLLVLCEFSTDSELTSSAHLTEPLHTIVLVMTSTICIVRANFARMLCELNKFNFKYVDVMLSQISFTRFLREYVILSMQRLLQELYIISKY